MRALFYVVAKLGPKMSMTPEGFLLCEDVPIARTGQMMYGVHELPVKDMDDAPGGVVYIDRFPDEVFKPEAIASFNGKPAVNEHPKFATEGTDTITPENWNELSIGTILNPRRGTDGSDDVLMADLMIKNQEAIQNILDGKREVSCGYACDYIKTAPGRAYQTNIIGNHVALVQKGRCGVRCRIGDEAYQGAKMKIKEWFASFIPALKANDEKETNRLLGLMPARLLTLDEESTETEEEKKKREEKAAADSAGGRSKYTDEMLDSKFAGFEKQMADGHGSIMKSLDGMKTRLGIKDDDPEERAIEGELKEEAPAGTGDMAVKATDSAYLEESYSETLSLAEIISPGLHMKSFDSKADPRGTYKNICGMRRKALQLGNNDSEMNGIIEKVRGGRALTADGLEHMPCGDVRVLFLAVGAYAKEVNSRAAGGARITTGDAATKHKTPSLAEINERNRKFYAAQSGN